MNGDTLVSDYMRRLGEEARRVIPQQADDLVADVREHIEAALARADQRDEAAVRSVLDRLGSPEVIVAAAEDQTDDVVHDARSPDTRSAIVRFGPVLLGAIAGVLSVLAWAPMYLGDGSITPGLPVLVAAVVIALLLFGRQGGVAFLASTLGIAGAVLIALALSVPLVCPGGPFASTCSTLSLGPIIGPGLGLIAVGALITNRSFRWS